MDARISSEMALQAAAHHRRVVRAIESRLTPEQRELLKQVFPGDVGNLLMERGAALALKKYGNAVRLRCDASEIPVPLAPLKSEWDELTPVRPSPKFLKG